MTPWAREALKIADKMMQDNPDWEDTLIASEAIDEVDIPWGCKPHVYNEVLAEIQGVEVGDVRY